MSSDQQKYETVIGLEVHAQLLTESKIFAPEATAFGAAPNTRVSTITLALPGVLPRLNRAVVDKAIMIGLACRSEITRNNRFARKNYFYPDLPKGYQISQDKTPICVGGEVEIDTENGSRHIRLTRIHMEEDAGKNNHEIDPYYSLIDLNRAGVPLIEIVSEPDMRSSDEAYAFLTEIRQLVRYLDICDGNMEEGSMRCDANISIRPVGSSEYGTKVEVKNMNSIRNVKRAIDNEVERQIEMVERGERIVQQTRSFNPVDGSTFPLRSKEEAHDYRYFPEPDLPPLMIGENDLNRVQASMPPLPRELFAEFTGRYGLSAYDAGVLTDVKEVALYFRDLAGRTDHVKAAANWVMGAVKSWMNEHALTLEDFPVTPEQIARLIALIDQEVLSSNGAREVFSAMVRGEGDDPEALAKELNLVQDSDENQLAVWAGNALALYPDKVEAYKAGKKGLLGLFMGEIMKMSKGKADPKKASAILQNMLN